MAKVSTIATSTNNCLEFEAGDFRLKVPEQAMSDGFKVAMGVTAGVSVATVVVLFGYGMYKIISTEVTTTPYAQYPVQTYNTIV